MLSLFTDRECGIIGLLELDPVLPPDDLLARSLGSCQPPSAEHRMPATNVLLNLRIQVYDDERNLNIGII